MAAGIGLGALQPYTVSTVTNGTFFHGLGPQRNPLSRQPVWDQLGRKRGSCDPQPTAPE